MKCLILAAGYATRLYPLTENFPKPLLEVGGNSILDWLVEDIHERIDEFVIISNHKYAPHFEKWKQSRPEKIVIVDDGTLSNETRLGAVRDIQFALDRLDIHEDMLVMAGDNLLDFSLKGFLDFCKEKQTSCVMCYQEERLAALQKTAVITVDERGRITGYEEKPQTPKGNLAVPPFYYYKAEDAARISEALNCGCGADAPGSYAAWLSKQVSMHAYVMPGKRYDIGNLSSYEYVKQVFSER